MRFGFFTGGIPVVLIHGKATLTSDMTYTTADGTTYTVPSGFTSDAASIPRAAWSIIGHPLTSAFVRPALLHDFHCLHKTIDSGRAHRVFYEGLRCEGVGWFRAQLMYRAVQAFGPRFTAVQ